MNASQLLLPDGCLTAVTRDVRSYGVRGMETGGFLMANVGTDVLAGIALAGQSGIDRRGDLFQISERALDRLFAFADDQGFWLPVQLHSHRLAAFMSRTDARHGLRVEGFVSTIIPGFASPPEDVDAWGWWQFQSGDWQPCRPAAVRPGGPELIIAFDEDGVREC